MPIGPRRQGFSALLDLHMLEGCDYFVGTLSRSGRAGFCFFRLAEAGTRPASANGNAVGGLSANDYLVGTLGR